MPNLDSRITRDSCFGSRGYVFHVFYLFHLTEIDMVAFFTGAGSLKLEPE